MPKGYWIPQIDVSNPEGYKAYMAATPPAHEKYRGTALVRGGKMEVVEGRVRSRARVARISRLRRRARLLPLATNISARSRCACRIRRSISSSPRATTARSRPPQGRRRPPPRRTRATGSARSMSTDPEGYKPYMAANQAPFGKFGARFLVRGGAREVPEGKARARTVVLEFPSYEAALACYRSPEYQAAKKLRDGKAEVDLVIVEGYDGPKF